MSDLQKKLEHLHWFRSIGIDSFLTTGKSLDNNLVESIMNKDTRKISKDNKKSTFNQIGNNLTKPNNSRESIEGIESIMELKEIVQKFNDCELKKFATNTVFIDGAENATVLLVGEAPGAKEDEEGRPFCGPSGILLDKLLESIGLSRESNVSIINSVFWRPPGNRRPTKEEIEICRPFVEKYIALLKPKLILMVGSTAATALLGKQSDMKQSKSNNTAYTNPYLDEPIQTSVIFHPAYLLRLAYKKKETWYELLEIRKILDNI